jgi:3-deoxy-D-manno-octulosonic-acid transferase
LKNINLFLVQTREDGSRLEKIGVDPSLIRITGNLKTEVDLPLWNEEKTAKLRRDLAVSGKDKLFLAGSTHLGEENQLLSAFSRVKRENKAVQMILAPRHPERSGDIVTLCQSFSLKVERRTEITQNSRWDVLVLDTIGELAPLYSLCDVAFIGGSLVPWGGQNLLEPAFYGKPIFFGPHMHNFAHLAECFVSAGAASFVRNEKDLIRMFGGIESSTLQEMGKMARETLASLQGATEKALRVMKPFVLKGHE